MALGRRYWTLWTSSAVANLGDGIFQVAFALVAVRLTRSPALIAGVALAARLPWLFVALPAGALADRLDRRKTMLSANAARVALLALLTVAYGSGVATIGLLYVVALGLGIAEVLFDTSSQTMMPAVVDKDDLSRANGRLFAVELVMNQFAGPPLGGFLVAASATVALGAGAGLYVLAVVALAMLPGSYRTVREGPPARLRSDIAEGLRYLTRHRVLRTLGLLLGAQNLLFMASGSLMILYMTSDSYGLGLSDEGVGLLFAITAAGGFAGSFIGAPIEKRFGRSTVLSIALTAGGVGILIPGLTRNVYIVAATGLLAGSAAMWNVITVSLRQRIIPDHLLGRVNSAYRLLGWGSMPIGAGLGGLLAELTNVRTVFLVAGGLVLVLIVPLRAVITDSAIDAAEAESEERKAAAAAPGEAAGADPEAEAEADAETGAISQ
ncbi:MAG TPA: MFS transporter [Acidimicrobiales bacterium]